MNKHECIAVCDKFALNNSGVNKEKLNSIKELIGNLFDLMRSEREIDGYVADISVFCKNNSSIYLRLGRINIEAQDDNAITELFNMSKKTELTADKENVKMIFELDVD